MSVHLEPLRNNLIIEIEPTAEKSTIISVQQSVEDLVRFGTIKAIGPEVKDAKVGQRVLASITAGHEVPGGLMILESAIIGLGE